MRRTAFKAKLRPSRRKHCTCGSLTAHPEKRPMYPNKHGEQPHSTCHVMTRDESDWLMRAEKASGHSLGKRPPMILGLEMLAYYGPGMIQRRSSVEARFLTALATCERKPACACPLATAPGSPLKFCICVLSRR